MATGGSPPKPWERVGAGGASSTSSTAVASAPTKTSVIDTAPSLPERPDALRKIANRNASSYSSGYGPRSSAYGPAYSSPYGYGGMSSYSSPYNRFGGSMGGMYGGGMYGGGMYGGMGGGMGYGSMGGMYGQQGFAPNGEGQSLTQAYTQSTEATFRMIESIVGAFGGFAQMLESTYMATQSSFFAMVSVAEQFGTLKQTLGSVLGIFALMRWIRVAVAKLTGRAPPASSTDLTPAKFAAFSGAPNPDGSPIRPKPSRKPLIFFIVAVFGLPYLMTKMIRALAASQEGEYQQRFGDATLSDGGQIQLDPSKLDFCRVLYDYTPQVQPGQQPQEGIDLAVKKGDLVAVLSKSDFNGQASEWWRCRARDGRMGYLPSPYLETIQRRPQAQIAANSNHSSPNGSRVNTMTTAVSPASRANSIKTAEREKVEVGRAPTAPPVIDGKPLDISVESFQRGGFYP